MCMRRFSRLCRPSEPLPSSCSCHAWEAAMPIRISVLVDRSIGRVGSVPVGCEETELSIRVRQHWFKGEFIYEPRARIYHRIAAGCTRFGYFRSRCYAEGMSEALVSQSVGTGDGLSAEWRHALGTQQRRSWGYRGRCCSRESFRIPAGRGHPDWIGSDHGWLPRQLGAMPWLVQVGSGDGLAHGARSLQRILQSPGWECISGGTLAGWRAARWWLMDSSPICPPTRSTGAKHGSARVSAKVAPIVLRTIAVGYGEWDSLIWCKGSKTFVERGD